MPKIRCESVMCLHNESGFCGVTDETVIDIDKDGKCIDCSPVTDEECFLITGNGRTVLY